MKSVRCPSGTVRVIGYVRVSTQRQVDSGLGLKAQTAQLEQQCAERGWCLQQVVTDAGRSAKTMSREGLSSALAQLGHGEADALMVAKSDRATRSVSDLYALMDASVAQGWSLVDLETDVDTTDPTGRMIAGMRGVVSQWEREIIGKRTKEALAQKKLEGVKLGTPKRMESASADRARELRRQGYTVQRIVDTLNAEAVPTAHGNPWQATVVRRIIGKGLRPRSA